MEYSCQKTTQFLMSRLYPWQKTRRAVRWFLWILTQLSWAHHMQGEVQATCMLTCVCSLLIACAHASESEVSSNTPAGCQSSQDTSKSTHIRGGNQIKVVNYMVKSSEIINEFVLLCQENKNYEHAFPSEGFMLKRSFIRRIAQKDVLKIHSSFYL